MHSTGGLFGVQEYMGANMGRSKIGKDTMRMSLDFSDFERR